MLRPAALVLGLILVAAAVPGRAAAGPLAGRGMWLWYINRSDGGDLATIAARARSSGVRTLYVKAGDGAHAWSQFNRTLVTGLHARGLRVCAWQYVYGNDPLGEADVAAAAVARGADCFVIDAEAEYEGKYASAQAYILALRRSVGYAYPIALASFPYVDLHPGFPFSVFLGRHGAQVDMPQMYWRDIGQGVASVFHRTWRENRIYGRAIVPLGETYNGATGEEARAFRGLTVRYGAPGVTWWDYAWTGAASLWDSIAGFYTAVSAVPAPGYPLLTAGSAGDQVVRLQEFLAGAIPGQRITGTFGSETRANLLRFQAARGLAATGESDEATWRALLRIRPVWPTWGASGAARDATAVAPAATASAAGGSAAGRRFGSGGAPLSAALPARRDEIRPEPLRAEAP